VRVWIIPHPAHHLATRLRGVGVRVRAIHVQALPSSHPAHQPAACLAACRCVRAGAAHTPPQRPCHQPLGPRTPPPSTPLPGGPGSLATPAVRSAKCLTPSGMLPTCCCATPARLVQLDVFAPWWEARRRLWVQPEALSRHEGYPA